MPKTAIIAAMPRELSELTQGWCASTSNIQNREVKMWETENAIAACAGIGTTSARIAAEAVWQHTKGGIGKFISAGLAGALAPELQVGDIVTPEEIVETSDGLRIKLTSGAGLLVTANIVSGKDEKYSLAKKYSARAVDMEAYAVADVARIYNMPCIAIKAISDELDFPMPELTRFVDAHGNFSTAQFVLHAAVRPLMWGMLMELGSNTKKATTALTTALREAIDQ